MSTISDESAARSALHGQPDSHLPVIFTERRERIRDAWAALIVGDVDALEEAVAKATRAGKICRAFVERTAAEGGL